MGRPGRPFRCRRSAAAERLFRRFDASPGRRGRCDLRERQICTEHLDRAVPASDLADRCELESGLAARPRGYLSLGRLGAPVSSGNRAVSGSLTGVSGRIVLVDHSGRGRRLRWHHSTPRMRQTITRWASKQAPASSTTRSSSTGPAGCNCSPRSVLRRKKRITFAVRHTRTIERVDLRHTEASPPDRRQVLFTEALGKGLSVLWLGTAEHHEIKFTRRIEDISGDTPPPRHARFRGS
jgi:hypothetical protein